MKFLWLLLVLSLPPLSPTFAAEPPPAPGPRDRCAVCGMFVAPFTSWVASLRLAEGTAQYFDGPKDLYRYLQQRRERGESVPAPEEVFVTEYYSARAVSVTEVWFAAGSDVVGPMGNDLVPIRGEAQAREFLRDHKGRELFRHDQINAEVLSSLR